MLIQVELRPWSWRTRTPSKRPRRSWRKRTRPSCLKTLVSPALTMRLCAKTGLLVHCMLDMFSRQKVSGTAQALEHALQMQQEPLGCCGKSPRKATGNFTKLHGRVSCCSPWMPWGQFSSMRKASKPWLGSESRQRKGMEEETRFVVLDFVRFVGSPLPSGVCFVFGGEFWGVPLQGLRAVGRSGTVSTANSTQMHEYDMKHPRDCVGYTAVACVVSAAGAFRAP